MKALARRLRRWMALELEARANAQLVLLGALHARRVRTLPYPPRCDPPSERLRECQFTVFSQWGEDGIREFLESQHIDCGEAST